MTFTQAIKQIRDLSRDDITGIVSDYVDLKRSGNGMKGCCPFHDEKTPSFHVSDQKGIYKCFGCGLGGDAIDFVMRIDGKEFHEVIYQFADRFHITIENNSTGTNNQEPRKPEPIPDLKQVRSEIRKAGLVTVICDDTTADEIDSKAAVKIPASFTPEEAHALRKLTSRCELVVGQVAWENVRESIKSGLAEGFTVSIRSNGQSMDWIYYVSEVVQPERGDIIKLLAAIPDSITRSVYMTEYSNLAFQNSEAEVCQ
jgi:hypothetical protein